jgi:poly(3-hydroxybutyrate) depolymerase
MNILKNMEVIFVAAAILSGVTAYATAATPEHALPRIAIAAPVPAQAAMQVVVVSAKRLSAAEKLQISQ